MVSLFGLDSATFSEFKKTAIDRFERITGGEFNFYVL
jgi:hypothetical protein